MDNFVIAFNAHIAETKPGRIFPELHRLFDSMVGVTLFTCSRFDLKAGTAERIYTSDESSYPLTGMKSITPNRWTEIVLDNRQTFCAETIEDLRDVFPDHEKIEALGLGSAINIPAFVCGQILGTVNLLNVNNSYSSRTVDQLQALSVCATLAFLSYLHSDEPA